VASAACKIFHLPSSFEEGDGISPIGVLNSLFFNAQYPSLFLELNHLVSLQIFEYHGDC